MFTDTHSKIFKGNITMSGTNVHTQQKNTTTGLYDITLDIEQDTEREREAERDLENEGEKTVVAKTCSGIRDITSKPHIAWAARVSQEKARKVYTHEEREIDKRNISYMFLARFYIKEGMGDLERWHNKLGHQNMNVLRKCNIDKLKIPNKPYRCEYCINAKMHSGEHSTKSNDHKTDLHAGEYIITDLQGPYAQTKNGEKYLQIFIDVKSRKVWVAKLKNKTDSDKAIESVVRESYIRSRNKLRVLRTDGDGIFGRSKSFQELREREIYT